MDSLFSILKIYRILLNFHSTICHKQFIRAHLFLYARLCVTKICPKFATCSVRHNFTTY